MRGQCFGVGFRIGPGFHQGADEDIAAVPAFDADAADLDIKALESEFMPKFSIVGDIFTQTDLVGIGNRNVGAKILGHLNVPIYEGGLTSSRVRQAKEQLGQQRINVDIVRDQVRQAVASGWGAVEATKLQVLAAQAQVQASEVALAGVREEAKVGQRTTLDVLNAQQTVATGRVALVTAQRDRVVATYTLLSAMGRLSAQTLALRTERYDSHLHFKQVRDKFIGLDTPGGR